MNEEEIEKAIKLLKESVDNPKIYSKRCVYFDEYQMDKLKQLSYKLIEELKQEKEKNKKLEEVIKLMANDMERLGSIDELIGYYFKKARGEEE